MSVFDQKQAWRESPSSRLCPVSAGEDLVAYNIEYFLANAFLHMEAGKPCCVEKLAARQELMNAIRQ
jgi:hypothetical protein